MNNEFAGKDEFKLEGEAFIDMRLLDQLSDIKELCAAFAKNPLGKNGRMLGEAIDAHFSAVRIAFEQNDDKSGSEQNIDEILRYAQGLEKQRIDFLNEIDGQEPETYSLVDEDYDAIRDHLLNEECEDNESVADHVYGYYQSSFRLDMNQLSAISASNYEKNPSVKRKEMMKKIGFQALDVAKVSLGVVIGVAVAKKSKLL